MRRVVSWAFALSFFLLLCGLVVWSIGWMEGESEEGREMALWLATPFVTLAALRLAWGLLRLLARIPRVLPAAKRGLGEVRDARARVLADLPEPSRRRLASLPSSRWLRLQTSLYRAFSRQLRDGPATDGTDRLRREVAEGYHDRRLAHIAGRVSGRQAVDVTDLRVLLLALTADDSEPGHPGAEEA